MEICCTSLDDALAAGRGGADRIELCEDLAVGGVTPGDGLVDAVKAAVDLPVFVLVRARGGDFCFERREIDTMLSSIARARELGADGIVCGALTPGGEVDRDACARMVEAARPLPFTFHRALDACADRGQALRDLRGLGVDRVLTSGGQERASDDPGRMRGLVQAAGDGPTVLCCGGVRSTNVAALLRDTGLREFHSAARTGVGPVEEGEVRALREALAAGA